ncbi:MAG: polymer-forming cytoskeletal protein, partial [Acidobacteria bacterium]|nr:polymer-forming cytoskeletal protein [Acidobacteriota bacterium]
MKHSRSLVFLVALVWFLLPTRADAQRERVQVGRDIEVGPNETVGEAVCIGCSIRVQGIIRGEAVAVGGGIEIDGEIHG